MRLIVSFAALAALMSAQVAQAQTDPDNPTCPRSPNFSNNAQMRLSVEEIDGRQVLLAEGSIDDGLIPRLQEAIRNFQGDEMWIRSPGGNARVGNQAGRLIRENNMTTRIPEGWACFSACNFMFMGGVVRYVDRGGLFVVHMFTHTNDRATIRSEVARGEQNTLGLIGDIEQQSALLASEDNDFLIRMGISRKLLTEVMYRQRAVADSENRSTRRCLTQEEVNRYFVTTVPWTEPGTPAQAK